MKVLFYSIRGFDKPLFEKKSQGHEFSFTEESLDCKNVIKSKGFRAVSIFSSDKADEEVINDLHSLGVKFISLRSVGYDHVDLEVASKLGIRVANVPSYSPNAIAEHAVAMLMALNRKLIKAHALFQQSDFRLDDLMGFDLFNKTVGIIGTGNIGMAFASIMQGFGCKILAFDPIRNPRAEDYKINYCTLAELLQNSDVVSLHCPLNKQTKYLMNKHEFSIMKSGSILINTARGSVVNTDALIHALESGKLAGACLDVYEFEKGIYFNDMRNRNWTDITLDKLRAMDNVLLTAHQAFLTKEALQGIADATLQNLNEWEVHSKSANDLV